MRFSSNDEPAWVEGVVNRKTDHVSICYGENRKAVALIAQRSAKRYTVQFLMKPRRSDPRTSKILEAVRRELQFYLRDVVGPDSWSFVQYHCGTPANFRSIVHWTWNSKSNGS